MKIHVLLKAYEKERRSAGYSQQTINRVALNVNLYSRDTGITTIKKMTTISVVNWGGHQLLQGKRQSTLYAYYNSIRSFICYLDDIGIEHELDKERIRCKPIYERLVCLRTNDVKRISNNADWHTSLLIRMMYTSGMRISEAISLTPAMLDGDEAYFKGKGGKLRTVFITKEISRELASIRDGDKPYFNIDRSTAYYRIKKAMVEAGYPNAYPHSLRHTFTTTMLRNGASLSHVQRLLGHSNISTTQRYEHLVTDDIRKAHSKYLVTI